MKYLAGHYRGYTDKTVTAQLKSQGGSWAGKEVISLAEGAQSKGTWGLVKEAFLEEAAFELYSEGWVGVL